MEYMYRCEYVIQGGRLDYVVVSDMERVIHGFWLNTVHGEWVPSISKLAKYWISPSCIRYIVKEEVTEENINEPEDQSDA